VERVEGEALGLFCPGATDRFVGRQTTESLQPSGEVVGCNEVGQVLPKLGVALVVISPDRCFFQRPVHSFDLPVIRYEIGGAFLVRLFSLEDGPMVSPSGTRGTGSTKERAGRQQTLG
jgi:hypothetical protein